MMNTGLRFLCVLIFVALAFAMPLHAEQPVRTYGNLTYPAKGNIQLDEGTVELYVISGFDSQEEWKHASTYGTLFNIVMPEENWSYTLTFITWGHAIAMIGYAYPQQSYVWNGAGKWKPGESHVVAWTWSGRKRSVFADGEYKFIGKGGAKGSSIDNVVEGPLHGDLTKAQLMIGRGHSVFTIDEVRISSIARTPEELMKRKDAAPVADAHTLLLDHCDGGPADVISKFSGETAAKTEGSFEIVDGKYGKAIKLWKDEK